MKNNNADPVSGNTHNQELSDFEAALLASEQDKQLHLNQLMQLVMSKCVDGIDNGEYRSIRVPFADAKTNKAWIDLVQFKNKAGRKGKDVLLAGVTSGEWEEMTRTQECTHYLIFKTPDEKLDVWRTECSGEIVAPSPVMGASRLHRHDMQEVGTPMYRELEPVEDVELKMLIIGLGAAGILQVQSNEAVLNQ